MPRNVVQRIEKHPQTDTRTHTQRAENTRRLTPATCRTPPNAAHGGARHGENPRPTGGGYPGGRRPNGRFTPPAMPEGGCRSAAHTHRGRAQHTARAGKGEGRYARGEGKSEGARTARRTHAPEGARRGGKKRRRDGARRGRMPAHAAGGAAGIADDYTAFVLCCIRWSWLCGCVSVV